MRVFSASGRPRANEDTEGKSASLVRKRFGVHHTVPFEDAVVTKNGPTNSPSCPVLRQARASPRHSTGSSRQCPYHASQLTPFRANSTTLYQANARRIFGFRTNPCSAARSGSPRSLCAATKAQERVCRQLPGGGKATGGQLASKRIAKALYSLIKYYPKATCKYGYRRSGGGQLPV